MHIEHSQNLVTHSTFQHSGELENLIMRSIGPYVKSYMSGEVLEMQIQH